MECRSKRLYSSNIAVIKEVYDSEYSQQCFSLELEKALEAQCSIIVIEPTKLADETARWIWVGNLIHKTNAVSALSSIVGGIFCNNTLTIQLPLTIISSLCTALYTLAWQFDPCIKYQVENDSKELAKLPISGGVTETAPVVLVRKENTYKTVFHWTASISAIIFCIYKSYKTIK